MALRLKGSRLFRCEPGGIAITISLQAGHVVTLVFSIGQYFGFGRTKFRIVTGFLPVFAGSEITLVFREGSLFRLGGSKHRVIAVIPAIRAVRCIALALCRGRFLGLRKTQLRMIAEPGAVLAVGCVELLPGTVHGCGFCRGQLRAVTRARPVFAVGEVTPLGGGRRITRFGRRQFRGIARLHSLVAVGDIMLVIGYRQRLRFGFGKFRMVTGSVAVSAVRNVASVAGDSHFRQLRCAQLRRIARRSASLAGLQIFHASIWDEIGRLSKHRQRPETKEKTKKETETGRRCPKRLPQTRFHVVRLLEDSTGSVSSDRRTFLCGANPCGADRNWSVIPVSPKVCCYLDSKANDSLRSYLASATWAW